MVTKLKNKLYVLIISILYLFIVGCGSNENIESSRFLGFDITHDGNYIVYSCMNNGKSSIYRANIDGSDQTLIFESPEGLSFYNPMAAHKGENIVFLGIKSASRKNSIWIGNIDGDGLTQLTDSSTLKAEVTFSIDDQSIYFTEAGEYGSYSPIGRPMAHDFDIFALDLKSKSVRRISSLNAYSLSDISDLDSLRILLSLSDKDRGIFFLQKESKKNLSKIIAVNDTLRDSKGYSNPVLIDSNHVVCSSYYQLVNIDIKNNRENIILPSTGEQFDKIRYNRHLGKIFFMKKDLNNIYIINTDGSDLYNIEIATP